MTLGLGLDDMERYASALQTIDPNHKSMPRMKGLLIRILLASYRLLAGQLVCLLRS